MSEIKLLPCPFCGGKARISCDPEATKDSMGRLWAFTVVCDSCCATSGLCYSSEMATKSWNQRKPMERILTRLEEVKGIFEKELEECIFKALPYHDSTEGKVIGIKKAIKIVKEEGAE